MNRLIIIGNGFDLAHGIKTSYLDFITYYIRISFQEAFQKRAYKDVLMKIVVNNIHEYRSIKPETIFDFQSYLYSPLGGLRFICGEDQNINHLRHLSSRKHKIHFVTAS